MTTKIKLVGSRSAMNGESYKNNMMKLITFDRKMNTELSQATSYLFKALSINPNDIMYVNGRTANSKVTEKGVAIASVKPDGTIKVVKKDKFKNHPDYKKDYNVSIKSSDGSVQIAVHSLDRFREILKDVALIKMPDSVYVGLGKFLGFATYADLANKQSKYVDNRRRGRFAFNELTIMEQKSIEDFFTQNFDAITSILLTSGATRMKKNKANLYCFNRGSFTKNNSNVNPFFMKMEDLLTLNQDYAAREGAFFKLGHEYKKRGITGFNLGLIGFQMAGNKSRTTKTNAYHYLQAKLSGRKVEMEYSAKHN